MPCAALLSQPETSHSLLDRNRLRGGSCGKRKTGTPAGTPDTGAAAGAPAIEAAAGTFATEATVCIPAIEELAGTPAAVTISGMPAIEGKDGTPVDEGTADTGAIDMHDVGAKHAPCGDIMPVAEFVPDDQLASVTAPEASASCVLLA